MALLGGIRSITPTICGRIGVRGCAVMPGLKSRPNFAEQACHAKRAICYTWLEIWGISQLLQISPMFHAQTQGVLCMQSLTRSRYTIRHI